MMFNFDYILNSGGSEYLSDIISDGEYKKFFAHSHNIYVLNKQHTGNGGSTGFLNYAITNNIGLLLLVPNISIVIDKMKDGKGIVGVYGGADYDTDKPIVVATWDQIHNISQHFMSGGFIDNFTSWCGGRTIVIDEYHKLVSDSSYRDICTKLTNYILRCDETVTLMSATPSYKYIDMLRQNSDKEVVTYNVKYDENKRVVGYTHKNKTHRNSNTLFSYIEKVIERRRNNQHILIFYNSVKECGSIIHRFRDTSIYNDIELLCSSSSVKKAVKYSEHFSYDKHIHFLTSAYFTGMDVKCPVDRIVIIGGPNQLNLCYSASDIKQMIGRARKGVSYINILHNGHQIDCDKLNTLKTQEKLHTAYVSNASEEEKANNDYIKMYVELLRIRDDIERMTGWCDYESMVSMLNVYKDEYVLKDYKAELDLVEHIEKVPQLKLKEVKKMIVNGDEVSSDQYRWVNIVKEYFEVNGADMLLTAGLKEMQRWFDIHNKIKDVRGNVSEIKKLMLSDGFYSYSQISSLCSYMGYHCDEDDIEIKINEIFDVTCVRVTGKMNKRKSRFIVIGSECWFCYYPNLLHKKGTLLYKRNVTNLGSSRTTINPAISIRTSPLHHKTKSQMLMLNDVKPISIKELEKDYWVKEYSQSLNTPMMSHLKESNRDKYDIMKMSQTFISDIYNSDLKCCPHTIEYLNKMDCIIVDIDDSISFSRFKEIYRDINYIAYPTFSNKTEDWTKYRVIFALDDTITVPNLKVVKTLRKMVCKYEDDNHQIGAYINEEQWEMRYVNEGIKNIHINQYIVDYITYLFEYEDEFWMNYSHKISDIKLMIDDIKRGWDIDKCKSYVDRHDKDDERHISTFVVKKNISQSDRCEFEKWLYANKPHLMKHWSSHRI